MNVKRISSVKEKEVFEPAKIETIVFQVADIITTSIAGGGFGGFEDPLDP